MCPATYNKADYVVSILNSGSVLDKKNVNTMCELSSTVAQMNTEYNAFNKDVRRNKLYLFLCFSFVKLYFSLETLFPQVQSEYRNHLQTLVFSIPVTGNLINRFRFVSQKKN